MTNPRDIFLQQFKPTLDNKADSYPPFRAVLTGSTGQTDTGDVWKDENARLVWFRAWGSGSPAWALCDVLEPVRGLGVFIKFNVDINQYEVLRDDPLMRSPDSDRTSYRAITNQDLLKGGRFQLWLEPTMFIPLSIYPTGNDTVSVVSGDYIFGGERKTFAGSVDLDLSGSRPAAGLHRLVGLYLDSSNTLNTIDGATVATGTDADDPAWPSNVLRLGVVDIDNATAISINDIDNRKVVWTEDDSTAGGNVWPRADEVNIDNTSYASWALAIDALAASDQAIIGEGSFDSDNERIDTDSFVKGSGVDVSILETTTKDRVLDLAISPIILEDFTLSNIYTATLYGDYYAAYIDENASIDAFRVKFVVTGSGGNINYGCYIASAGTHRFAECIWDVRNGTTNYALYLDAQGLYSGTTVELFDPDITGDVHNEDGTLNIYGGVIDGDLYAGDGATINLYNVPLITGTVSNHSGGTINGWDNNADTALIGRSPQSILESKFALDQQLTNTYGVSFVEHFRQNSNSVPTGWTETDAAESSRTDSFYSFWQIGGSNVELSWDYKKQTGVDLEVDASGGAVNLVIGPCFFKDGQFTADIDYYLGLYRDNAGIDVDTFTRVHLQWDSAGTQWRIRGQVKDSTSGTQFDGNWYILSDSGSRLTYPFYFFCRIIESTKQGLLQVGSMYWLGVTDNLQIYARIPSTVLNYGDMWVRFHQTRGAGARDNLYVGAVDIV